METAPLAVAARPLSVSPAQAASSNKPTPPAKPPAPPTATTTVVPVLSATDLASLVAVARIRTASLVQVGPSKTARPAWPPALQASSETPAPTPATTALPLVRLAPPLLPA